MGYTIFMIMNTASVTRVTVSLIIFAILPFFVLYPLGAQETAFPPQNEINLIPEVISSQEEKLSSFVIKTNTQNAAVYVNSIYRGLTPLSIENLQPGLYHIRIEKTGYETSYGAIYLQPYKHSSYYVQLTESMGYIQFNINPDQTEITIDDKREDHTPVKLQTGIHRICINKFGYIPVTKIISVVSNETQTITLTMEKAPFSLSDITISRPVFNPFRQNNRNNCSISFLISGYGSGTLFIYNAEGIKIRSIQVSPFTTWKQNVFWDGKNDNGETVREGIYKIELTVTGSEDSVSYTKQFFVHIDSMLKDSLLMTGPYGEEILSATETESGIYSFQTSFGSIIQNKTESAEYGYPLACTLEGFPFTQFRYSLSLSAYTGINTSSIPLSAEFCSIYILPSSLPNIRIAFFAKYGYTNELLYNPYGADTGNGLGAGITTGFSTSHIYLGFLSSFTRGIVTGVLSATDCTLKNTISFQYTSPLYSTGIWGTTHTCFGYAENTENIIASPIRAVEGGIAYKRYITPSNLVLGMESKTLLYSTGKLYILSSVNITFLF